MFTCRKHEVTIDLLLFNPFNKSGVIKPSLIKADINLET